MGAIWTLLFASDERQASVTGIVFKCQEDWKIQRY